jgi:hypothetical protein
VAAVLTVAGKELLALKKWNKITLPPHSPSRTNVHLKYQYQSFLSPSTVCAYAEFPTSPDHLQQPALHYFILLILAVYFLSIIQHVRVNDWETGFTSNAELITASSEMSRLSGMVSRYEFERSITAMVLSWN